MGVTNNNFFKVVIFIISVLFSGLLLELSGLNASQANILSLSTFSLPVFIIFGICVNWMYNSARLLSIHYLQKQTRE